jgi:hypothetical protein
MARVSVVSLTHNNTVQLVPPWRENAGERKKIKQKSEIEIYCVFTVLVVQYKKC